jgi:cation diffusion facilitator family transporter
MARLASRSAFFFPEGRANASVALTATLDRDCMRTTTEQMVERGIRFSLISIAVNALLATLKCLTGLVGHSFALLADGIESFSDVISSSVIYWGLRFAIKPPDKDHPYGHGKAEPAAAVMVGVALILAGLGIAIQSIILIRTPHPLPRVYTLWVLLSVVALKTALSRYAQGLSEKIDSAALKGDALHHFSDAITSAFAFVGITAALLTGNPTADDWAALCAAPIIAFGGWRQIRRPLAELLDTAPPPEIEQRVRSVAKAVPSVIGLEKCFVRKVGFRYYVDLHVVVRGDLTVREGHSIAHQVENRVLERVSPVSAVMVHIEPEEELLANKRGRRATGETE